MSLFQAKFEVDAIRLKMEKEPEKLLEYLKSKQAADLGKLICKHIPFQLDQGKSCDMRLVPDPRQEMFPANRGGDGLVQVYSCDLIAFSRKDWMKFRNRLRGFVIAEMIDGKLETVHVTSLLEELEQLSEIPQKPVFPADRSTKHMEG